MLVSGGYPRTFFFLPFGARIHRVEPLERLFCHTTIVLRFSEIGRKPELDFQRCPIWDVRGWGWQVAPAPAIPIQNPNGPFGFWSLEFGVWIWDCGFWISDFRFWILGCCGIRSTCGRPKHGRLNFGFRMLDFGFCARFGLCKRLLLLPAARVGGSYFNLASSIITYYSVLMPWTLKSSCFGFIEDQCALLISLVRIPAILPSNILGFLGF